LSEKRLKKNVLLSILNQIFVSVFQFGISLYMVRFWGLEDFGFYTIIFTVSLIIIGLQNALFNTPYSVVFFNALSEIESTESINILNVIFVILVSVITFFILLTSYDFILSYLICLYFVTNLLREFIKNKEIVEDNLSEVCAIDVMSIFLGMIMLVSAHFAAMLTLHTVFFIIIISNIVMIIYFHKKILSGCRIKQIVSVISVYKNKIWCDSKWSLVGMLTTEVQAKSYIFLITTFAGVYSVGLVQGARVIFGPMNLIVSAWGRVTRPHVAMLFDRKEYKKIKVDIVKNLIFFVVVNVLFALMIFPFYSHFDLIYSDELLRYENFSYLLILWWVVTLLLHIRSVFSVYSQAMIKFKDLAKATLYGSLFTIVMSIFILNLFEFSNIVLSIIFGEFFSILYIYITIINRVGHEFE